VPTTGNLANLKNEKQCVELRELASKESDQHKLGAYFEGILRLPEIRQAQLEPRSGDCESRQA
jgi:hypothetical protein